MLRCLRPLPLCALGRSSQSWTTRGQVIVLQFPDIYLSPRLSSAFRTDELLRRTHRSLRHVILRAVPGNPETGFCIPLSASDAAR